MKRLLSVMLVLVVIGSLPAFCVDMNLLKETKNLPYCNLFRTVNISMASTTQAVTAKDWSSTGAYTNATETYLGTSAISRPFRLDIERSAANAVYVDKYVVTGGVLTLPTANSPTLNFDSNNQTSIYCYGDPNFVLWSATTTTSLKCTVWTLP